MQPARSRFSHRHLLALSTFLIPLAILAALGWSELQRSGASAEAALEREAKQFLVSARQAIEQQLDRYLPEACEASKSLAQLGPVRTTLAMAGQERTAALRGIVLLDEQAGVLVPTLPLYSVNLPLARDLDLERDNPLRSGLQGVDFLLQHQRYPEAIALMEPLLELLATANPPGEGRTDLDEAEAVLRFRLATARLVTGATDEARAQLRQVKRLLGLQRNFRDPLQRPLGLLTELKLAELATADERLGLLRAIAENKLEAHPDGMLSAAALRLAASFPSDHPARREVDELLREEHQRAAIRTFAADYDLAIKPMLRLRRTRHTGAEADGSLQRQLATIDEKLLLVCVRPATAEEAKTWTTCTGIGLCFDLRAILGPTWRRFTHGDSAFVLGVREEDNTIIAPPATVPADYIAPTVETEGMSLFAYPADPQRLAAESAAAARKRTLLILFLTVTALGGALWSWRSVSREAELAALKIELVSRVSHELKTPLALVRMYGETLSMGRARDNSQAAEFGGIIAREAERLTALIQRILDFSRQQAGTLSYARVPIDLGELMRTVAAAYTPHLESRGVVLIDSLPLGITVACDANAAESALVNLLENAAKYGRDGDDEHEVELTLVRENANAVVEVRDRGRGIPEAERDRVFEGFYRASNAGEVRGAGLGLSLVRHFARAHDGDVQALPRPGGGTVMRLTLPLANAPDEPSVSTAHDTPHPAGPESAAKP